MLGAFFGAVAGLGIGVGELFVFLYATQWYVPCPGGGACQYSLGAVVASRALVAISVAAFFAGIWLAARGRPCLAAIVMTAAIFALLPPTVCGMGLALGGYH